MGIIIKELTAALLQDINKANDEFIIDSKAILHYINGKLSYTVVPVPERLKKYEPETPAFYASYLDSPDKACFIAYVDGEVAGQILLRRNWNRFAWVDDFGVGVKFRRQGIGKALMSRAEEWARIEQYPGIMLETQDTNVKACRFYEKYGFILGGFDTYSYHAADRNREEIALYWYLVFGN